MSQTTLYNNYNDAGWSSQVARKAHNLEAVGSNPAPATSKRVIVVHSPGGFVKDSNLTDLRKKKMLNQRTTERRWHQAPQGTCPCCAIIAVRNGHDNKATVEGMPALMLF